MEVWVIIVPNYPVGISGPTMVQYGLDRGQVVPLRLLHAIAAFCCKLNLHRKWRQKWRHIVLLFDNSSCCKPSEKVSDVNNKGGATPVFFSRKKYPQKIDDAVYEKGHAMSGTRWRCFFHKLRLQSTVRMLYRFWSIFLPDGTVCDSLGSDCVSWQ